MKIVAHTLTFNEENFIWYCLMAAVDLVDKIMVWDTGSEDKTVEVIEDVIKKVGKKIEFKQIDRVTKKSLVEARQAMLDQTKADWVLILDADDIWPKKQLQKLINRAESSNKNIIALVNRTKNCIGDVYHYLPESAGRYKLVGVSGNLSIRLMRNTDNLQVFGKYPQEAFVNKNGIINNQDANLLLTDSWYLHTTYLQRSSVGSKTSGSLGKVKIWEKGLLLRDNDLPEVFYGDRPNWIYNPLKKRGMVYESLATVLSPVINLKRKLKG